MNINRSMLLLVLTIVAPLAMGESAKDALNRLRTNLSDVVPKDVSALVMPSDADEITSGREVAATILAVAPPVDDASLQRYVNLVGRWIASQGERPDLPWQFVVIDSPDMNAFAVPGGYVLITRGLYDSLSEPSELAGVLGHEIAHIVRRHHVKAALSSKIIAEGTRRVGEILNPEKQTTVGNLLGAGASLMTRKLDQHSEFEADRMAVVLSGRAGFDPFGLAVVLARFEAVSGNDDRVTMLFQTHPRPKDRLQQLDAVMGNNLAAFGEPNAGGVLYQPVRN